MFNFLQDYWSRTVRLCPSNSCIEVLTPNVMVLWRMGFWKVIAVKLGSWECGHHDGINGLMRRQRDRVPLDPSPAAIFLNYSWFTMLCQLLLYSKVTQSYICIHIHSFSHTTSITFYPKRLAIVPCEVLLCPTVFLHWGKPMEGHSKKAHVCKQEESPHQEPISWHFDLGLPASRTVRSTPWGR